MTPMTSNEFAAASYSIPASVWRLMMFRGAQGDFSPLEVCGVRINCGMDKNAVRLALETPLRQTTFDNIRELIIRFPA